MKLDPSFIKYLETHEETRLDLEAEAQETENFKLFAKMLAKHCFLSVLEFAECQINDEQLEILSMAIAQNSSVRFIDLSLNPITDKGIKYLAQALEQNTSIQSINLSYISLTDESKKLINQSVCMSKSLTKIIPEEIITKETMCILSHKTAWKNILEKINSPSAASAEKLIYTITN